MSRKIKLSEDNIAKLVNEFKSSLEAEKFPANKSSYVVDLAFMNVDSKVKIIFTAEAYIKIKLLVADFSTEVQWQGFVERVDNKTFKITDIVIPPHEVSGTTVISDDEEYQIFMSEMNELGKINNLRFHGHSHVNMGVTPSGVDMKYRSDVIHNSSPFFDNYFQIFMIFNKKNEISGQVYDLENNILYETDDIEIEIEDAGFDPMLFLEDAHRMATEKTYTPAKIEPKKDKKDKQKGYRIDGYDDDDYFSGSYYGNFYR